MMAGALAPYEGALRRSERLSLVSLDGRVLPLAIQRYLADADEIDYTVLDRCVAPVLDVGCGPGRIVHALASLGKAALGVDIADFAVALTVQRGAPALNRSVFDRVPGEGRWPTVLVLDGNIGIGGDVAGLLARLTQLSAPGGALLVELSSNQPDADEVLDVHFGVGDAMSDGGHAERRFPWAVVGAGALARYAERAGLAVEHYWSAGDREFVRLVRSTEIR